MKFMYEVAYYRGSQYLVLPDSQGNFTNLFSRELNTSIFVHEDLVTFTGEYISMKLDEQGNLMEVCDEEKDEDEHG